MRRWLPSLIAITLCTSPVFAGEKVLLDTWDLVHFGSGRAGYVHTFAKEIDKDGKKQIHTIVELRLTVKRFDGIAEMAMDTGSIETAAGKVLGTVMKQYLGKKQQARIDGVIDGNQIKLTLDGSKPLNPAPWSDDVVGLYKQQSVFKNRDLKKGDKFRYSSFEPTINMVIKAEVVVKGYREVKIPGAKQSQRLLLVETTPDKVEFKRGADKVEKIQLPTTLTWLNEKFEPVKSEFDVPGLGPLVLFRSSKEKALAPITELTDINIGQLVRLKNRILRPHETTAAVYRITVKNDDNVATTFSRDDRQQVKNVKGNTFELHVKASKSTGGEPAEKEPDAEFTQSSYFITSENAKVKELARKAIGKEVDPWQKALRIEKWVHNNMKVTSDQALATADHVAQTLEGDCTEFAMLTAAMCRAEGVPSRTAIGLIYAEPTEIKKAPAFAFHMWTEVWIKGRWIAIDATLGKGYVGATHLKITDHSWHDERTMTPLFPVIRVVGRVSIDVLSAENK
jgi:Transglutaminase-like superfamily